MKYFRETENPTARLPAGFMQGFLEVGIAITVVKVKMANYNFHRVAIENCVFGVNSALYTSQISSSKSHTG